MSRLPLLIAVGALVVPPVASADVRIQVPGSLLGGRVAPANPLPAPDPGAGLADPDADEVALDDPAFWELVWPGDTAGLAAPDEVSFDCDTDPDATQCGVWGDAAADLDAPPAAAEVVADPLPTSTTDAARRLRPGIGSWMTSQTPRLSWTPETGATHYNVQVFLGPRRVASVWTSRTAVTLPPRVIDQGRYYMWAVWPAFGPRRDPRFGATLGQSVFGVVLRPRIVFRATAAGVRAEVRPRIPGGRLRLTAPAGVRAPRAVRIPATSRFTLPVTVAQAERITFRLVDQGTNPPKGIKRRGR